MHEDHLELLVIGPRLSLGMPHDDIDPMTVRKL